MSAHDAYAQKLMNTTATLRSLTVAALTMLAMFASAQLQSWVGTSAGPSTTVDAPVDIAIDGNGFAVVAGNSGGDIMVAKYNAVGAQVWNQRYNGAGGGTDTVSAVAIDSSGNVYVTGKVQTTATDSPMATLKLSGATGAVLWMRADGGSNGEGKDLVVTSGGAVYALGQRLNNGFVEMFVSQYAASTGAEQWSTAYDSTGLDTLASSLAVDAAGALYALGTRSLDPIGSDFVLVKLSSVGVQMWASILDGNTGFDEARALAIDPNGNVYAAGRCQFFDLDLDMSLFKVRQSDGGLVWKRFYDGFGYGDEANAVKVAPDGSAFLSGWLDDGAYYHVATVKYAPDGTMGYQTVRIATRIVIPIVQTALDAQGNLVMTTTATSGNTRADIYTIVVAPDGSVPWYRLWNDGVSGDDFGTALALDAQGSIYSAGSGFAAATSFDFKTVRYQRMTLTPATNQVVGGGTIQFTLALNSAAAQATAFTLSDSSSAASTPATATIGGGATSTTFNLTTSPVSAPESVTVTAKNSAAQVTATITLKPASPSQLTLTPATVVGGLTSTANVTLDGAAATGGLLVTLWDNHAAVQTPASLTVPAAATTASTVLTTNAVAASTSVVITASANGSTRTATLTLTANGPASLVMSPTTVVGGWPSTGTVTLNSPAPGGGAAVSLSSNQGAASVPASMTIAAGSTVGTFTANTSAVAANVTATITATRNGISKTATLVVQRAVLQSVTLNPNVVTGGTPSAGSVMLNGPAPTGGFSVTLASNSAARATVPASVAIPAGASGANFSATTFPQTADGSATISATLNGLSRTATLTVLKPVLASLIVSPDSVKGGNEVLGIAILTGTPKAGTTGITVALSSSNVAVVVPATVRIPAGATSQGFTVSSSVVVVDTIVTITGTAGTTRTATLVVIP